MQNLEALYVVEFGDVASVGYRNGGVAVLETNRIFGGDSGYHYIGEYSVFGDRFEARVQITKHNPSWINAFGDDTLQFEIEVSGRIRDRLIEAIMERTDRPGLRLLTRTTLLP